MSKVTITRLRNISSLEFEVPTSGVYVLTGSNGSGKTSLLLALNRICDKNAFSNLRIGRTVGMDKFANTMFTYSNGVQTVSYKRSNRGWEPTPRGVDIKSLFTFTESCFITTTGFRFYQPDTKTFYKQRGSVVYKDAAVEIKQGLNEVFNTHKFDNLKYVKIRNIRGRQKTLHRDNILYVIKELNNVYSEVHFSLGERMILNTLDFIQGLQNGGLLLIDEIELALHPVAQVQFFNLIRRIAMQKHLTCIISTHSSSLVKIAERRFYLENRNGTVTALTDCQPAYILKDISIADDNRPDYIFFVEDEMALRYLRAIIRKYQQTEDQHIFFNISYVGGYPQVLRLTEQFYSIPPFKKRQVQAFPDADFQEAWDNLTNKPNRDMGEQDLLNTIVRNQQNTTILDVTPEKDVWDWLVVNPQLFEQDVIGIFGQQMFNMTNIVSQVVAEESTRNQNNERKHAKFCFKNLSDKLMHIIPATSEDFWYERLISCYVDNKLSNPAEFNSWKQRIKSIVNRH